MHEGDRHWFQNNPGRRFRLRWATDEEIAGFAAHDGTGDMRTGFKFYQVIRRDGLAETFGTTALKGYGLIEASDGRIANLLRDRSPLLLD